MLQHVRKILPNTFDPLGYIPYPALMPTEERNRDEQCFIHQMKWLISHMGLNCWLTMSTFTVRLINIHCPQNNILLNTNYSGKYIFYYKNDALIPLKSSYFPQITVAKKTVKVIFLDHHYCPKIFQHVASKIKSAQNEINKNTVHTFCHIYKANRVFLL